ncbi:MAG: hypothetical protein ACLR0P_13685 [Oscillospiraceae bacterium]
MTGDLVNREDRELSRASSLARMAAETAPGLFGPGQPMRGQPRRPELRDRLEEAGVQVLEDRAVLWGLRGEGVNLMGLWDVTHDPLGWAHAQAALPERVRALRREGALNGTAVPPAQPAERNTGRGGADVVFCGHAHGGDRCALLARVPGVRPARGPVSRTHCRGVPGGETRTVVSRGAGQRQPLSPAVERAGAGGRTHENAPEHERKVWRRRHRAAFRWFGGGR